MEWFFILGIILLFILFIIFIRKQARDAKMPKQQQPHYEIRNIIALSGAFLFVVIPAVFILFEEGEGSFAKGGFMIIIYAIVLLGLIYWQFRKRQRRIANEQMAVRLAMEMENERIAKENERIAMEKAMESEIDKYLHKALEAMDTTHKWYNNEDEANKELVSCLKLQGVEAEYQYRLPNGGTADAKVYNFLIEGKLSPDRAEVNRLIGQLSDYSEYPYKINIVIYGRLSEYAERRIRKEINSRYLNKVFLTYLDKPIRQPRQ
jgi:cbb3-type cytochrome oxidase subunit 3